MTSAMIGLLGGAVLGLVNFGILRSVADRTEGAKPTSQKRQVANIMRGMAWADLIIFPAFGYFIVPMIYE